MKFAYVVIIALISTLLPTNVGSLWQKEINGKPISFYKHSVLFKKNNETKPTGFTLLNLDSGVIEWNETNELSSTVTYSDYALLFNNKVVIEDTKNQRMGCFNIESGKLLWFNKQLYGHQLLLIPGNEKAICIDTLFPRRQDKLTFYFVDLYTGNILNEVSPDIVSSISNAFMYAINSNYIVFHYDSKIWCFEFEKKKILWQKPDSLISNKNVIITNDYVIYSLNSSHCPAPDNYTISIVKIENGEIVCSLNGSEEFTYDKGFLYYYYYNQCKDFADRMLCKYKIKDNKFVNIKYNPELNVQLYNFYNDRITFIQQNPQTDGNYKYELKCYNSNLEEIYSSELSSMCFSSNSYCYEDYILINNSCKNINGKKTSELICYALPGYKPPESTSKPPLNLIEWLIRFILGRLMGTP